MITTNQIRKNLYFDSVTLMVASSMMRGLDGVINAAVMMGTDHNRSLMTQAGLIGPDTEPFGVNDTVVGVQAESDEAAQAAIAFFDDYIGGKKKSGKSSGEASARTLSAAKTACPGVNFTVISVPGRYARAEAEKAMELGMHMYRPELARRLGEGIRPLLGRTNDISRSYLELALDGYAATPVLGAAAELSGGGTEQSEILLHVGHSSGCDILEGLITTAERLEQIEEGRMYHYEKIFR